MKSILSKVFLISGVFLAISISQRNDFDPNINVLAEVLLEPSQTQTTKKSFEVESNDVDYLIEPLFEYDISGMVVSFAHHSGDERLHKKWGDHINIADICIVWDKNATDLDLNAFEFRNAQFTCYLETKNRDEFEKFQMDQLSNNHILSTNLEVRNTIKDVKIGDQVRFKGWLAKYSNKSGFSRGSSITRSDTGNGACETIYVSEFTILSSMKNNWRLVFNVSLLLFLSSTLLWLRGVYKGKI